MNPKLTLSDISTKLHALNLAIWLCTAALPMMGIYFNMKNQVQNLEEKVIKQEQALKEYRADRDMLLLLNQNFSQFSTSTSKAIKGIEQNTNMLVLINADKILKYQDKNIN